MTSLVSVATYRRAIGASLERVWENVRDWEHLPWLHRESFASIALEEEGDFGWRARVGLGGPASSAPGPREIRLELVLERDESYVARTLEGPGAGSEIWTRLVPVNGERTDIAVEFLVPDPGASARGALGDAYVALYTRLWDQDEAMMRRRTAQLAARRAGAAPDPLAAEGLDLGPAEQLPARLPLVVEIGGRRVRVLEHEGEWLAHDATCPHWLGPLEDAPIEGGRLVCPWHGYRFDLRSGRGCEGAARLRLAPAPRVEVVGGRVRLVPRGASGS